MSTQSQEQDEIITNWKPLTKEEIDEKVAAQTGFKLSEKMVASLIERVTFQQFTGSTLTVCILFLNSKAAIVGESSCIDPLNFDAELGRTFAYKDAIGKLLQKEGYTAVVIRAMQAEQPPQEIAEQEFKAAMMDLAAKGIDMGSVEIGKSEPIELDGGVNEK